MWYFIYLKVFFFECYVLYVFEINRVVLKKNVKMWIDDILISDW